jgi:hypothetical protein
MRVHLDILGWLYRLVGAVGLLTGLALGVLALGTVALADEMASENAGPSIARLFIFAGAGFVATGAAMVAIGGALGRRRAAGRRAAIVAGVLNLVFLPFGTALGVYSLWVLVNNDARLAFGRPPLGPDIQSAT